MDNTSLQNENSYLKEQLQKANDNIKRLETTEKTNLELVQKVSALEESVKSFLYFEVLSLALIISHSWQSENRKIPVKWSKR